ncbi:uncharacterized protein LOC107371620 [Tetranychus urticae]|uniref:uncharacterized protein LOC107371620 n=1 Tax=Tetranychus urticae TaxID=32264 RepID=UPI00077B918C|nr:uncharacterized protein LOC107371620 [Tetranychus urticae]
MFIRKMFPHKCFVFIFIILYDLTRLNEAYQQGDKDISELGTNFLIKAKLNYKEYSSVQVKNEKNWLIEESVFGDEKNSIVTLITQEKEGFEIKVFRDFKTQNISLICVQNECGRNADLLDKNLKGFPPGLTQIVKAALLLGPYRMIWCQTSEDPVYIQRQRFRTATYPCGTLYLVPTFRDSDQAEYFGIRDSNNRALTIVNQKYDYPNLGLSIQQTESLVKANVSMPTKGIHYKFNESITKYNELEVDREHGTTQLSITSLDSVTSVEIIGKRFHLEFVYDRKFGLKYIPSGHNECTIESSSVDDEFNYAASENYGKAFANELYFPKNPVEPYSKKLRVVAEHNVTIGNVKYDLVVKTYLEPDNASRLLVESGRLADFCVQMDLYSKSVPNKISYNFNLTEVRVICLIETPDYLNEDDFHRLINSYHQCFKDRKDKVILRLEIALLNHLMSDKIHELQAEIYSIKDVFRTWLVDKLNVSFLRMNLIKLNFLNSYMVAKVEIVDSFVTYFESKKGASHRFNIKSTESGQIYTSTIDECLRLQASKANLSYVITCETEHYLCLGIADGDSLPVENENGLNCMLYNNSDRTLTKLLAEVPLQVLIGKSYSNLNGSQFNYSDIEFAIVGVTIGDGILFDSPEKTKSNSFFVFFIIFSLISILINIVIFVKFAFYFKLSQRETNSFHDWVSLKLLKSNI